MARALGRTRWVRNGPSSCPRATLAFVGREAELARIAELVDHEVLFLIYGVTGIGKSEFAYRALELARARPGWNDVVPNLVQMQDGMDEHHLLALLRLRTGAHAAQVYRLGGPTRSLVDELEPVVRALNARRQLLLLDDLHLVDVAAAARILGHLARHVRDSRIFAASRLEIPLLTDAATPVVTRLAPLGDGAARTMLAHLVERLGVDVRDESGILRRAGGSPFFLQRELVSAFAKPLAPTDDRLGATLQALPAGARKLLLRAAVLSGRVAVSELGAGTPKVDDALTVLARSFFVHLADGMVSVHDLVRDAALRVATAPEIAGAHAAAVRLLTARTAAGGPEGALVAVEAVRHLCAAGEPERALAFIETNYARISGAGLDHLLVASLEALPAAVPGCAPAVDMLLARIFVRRSLIGEAQAVLTRIAADQEVASSVRYLTLAGTVALQRGDLRGAEECLQRAHAAVPPAAINVEHARIALHLADVLSMRGETLGARAVLEQVRVVCETLGGRTFLRWGWSAGVSWVLEEEFARTISTVAPFRELAIDMRADDLAAQLAMLEVLSRVETDDVTGARDLTDRIVGPAARGGALRAQLASFYAGLTAWAEGDLRAAVIALHDTWMFVNAHEHEVLGPIVGHYLGRVRLALGDVRGALELFELTARRAQQIGLGSLVPVGAVFLSRALLAAGDLQAARTATAEVLADSRSGGGAAPSWVCTIAGQAMARALALDGDLAGARSHIQKALAALPADTPLRISVILEQAEVELCGGDPAVVVQAAAAARNHYAHCGRRFLEACACVALAAGLVALGGPGDLACAEEAIARVEALIAHYGYEPLQQRATLVRSAIATRRGDRAAADRLLAAAMLRAGTRPSGRTGHDLLFLGCALGSARDHELPAGLRAQLEQIGLRDAAAMDTIVVDVDHATITSRHGAIKGRPITCALLACLIDGDHRAVSAETLYCTVWGGNEYHPLRNRNTVYVAMNRLRQALARLCPEQRGDLIETLPTGWRLGCGVQARKNARQTT